MANMNFLFLACLAGPSVYDVASSAFEKSGNFSVSGTRGCSESKFCTHRREYSCGRQYLHWIGWAASCDRVGRRAYQAALALGNAGATGEPTPTPHWRCERFAVAATNAARNYRLELRPSKPGGKGAVPKSFGFHRWMHAGIR